MEDPTEARLIHDITVLCFIDDELHRLGIEYGSPELTELICRYRNEPFALLLLDLKQMNSCREARDKLLVERGTFSKQRRGQ